MDSLVVIVVLGAALASVAVYAVVGRVLPGRWRKSDAEESESFAIESVNVLLGLLFSILLAFLIATVLSDYDKASSDAQPKRTPSAPSTASLEAYQNLLNLEKRQQELHYAGHQPGLIPDAAPGGK